MVKQDASVPASQAAHDQLVRALRQQLQAWEGRSWVADVPQLVPSDCSALDHLLPAGGFRRGTLVEWLAAGPGSGAATLSLALACQACQMGGVLVVVDARGWFHPPATCAWQLSWRQLVVVRPGTPQDHLWAIDQALRCPAVTAVWAEVTRLAGRDFRRLQLAAQQGGALGMLLRPLQVRGQPSWSDQQLWVQPVARQGPSRQEGWRLQIERLRGAGRSGQSIVQLELDSRTGTIQAMPLPASRQQGRQGFS